MRLKQIKLAGFKSFVDATKIPFLNSLTAIIGPNGCGKSNVIDAVRWVLGESSAKNLRGDSWADVIFNGSHGRKPVSVASVELVFDNSEGRIGGQYANYNEIALKRQVLRDGDNSYFLNGQKCRKKDITDIFMGTGLGPRSYAIIGQGTISRLIECKPQELRVFIEEAAGISRYKERRRDTENRIRHTRDNLDRLGDIRAELGKQLDKLTTQANAARRYRELKQQERQLHAQLLVMRYLELQQLAEAESAEISRLDTLLAQVQAQAEQLALQLTELKLQQDDVEDLESRQVAQFYQSNTEIAKVEQQISFLQERDQQLAKEQARLQQQLTDNETQQQTASAQLTRLAERQAELSPLAEQAEEIYSELTLQQQTLDEQLEQLAEQVRRARTVASEAKHRQELASTKEQHFKQQLGREQQQLQRLQQQLAASSEQSDSEVNALQQQLQQVQQSLATVTEQLEQADAELQQVQTDEQAQRHQCDEAKQQVSQLQQRQQLLANWLAAQQTEQAADLPQLWQKVTIAPGWEAAVEHWLKPLLQQAWLADANSQQSGFVATSTQQWGPIAVPANFAPWLAHWQFAADEQAAQSLLAELTPQQLILCQSGRLLGQGIQLTANTASGDSLVQMNAELAEIEHALPSAEALLLQSQQTWQQTQSQSRELTEQLKRLQAAMQQAQIQQSKTAVELTAAERRVTDAQQQRQQLQAEISATQARITDVEMALEALIEAQFAGDDELYEQQQHAQRLEAQLQTAQQQRQTFRGQLSDAERKSRELARQANEVHTAHALAQQQVTQLNAQHQALTVQLQQLVPVNFTDNAPQQVAELQLKLQQLLATQTAQQQQLEQTRAKQADLQNQYDAIAIKQKQQLGEAEHLTQSISTLKLRREGLKGQAETQLQLLTEQQLRVDEVAQQITADVTVEQRQRDLEGIRNNISRLGAINLAAIDEYEQQKQRKTYLDEQDHDLTQALTSLEEAIRRIDRETRSRFKATYEQVNQGLGELFPKVFGGGSAYLALTDDDLLDTGVTIMARPPGKKNSTIHLLSGGEKALTALSLVFAIFRLNPAPFCMLDEVDAPLDDANVDRFCRLLQEMSSSVQFIYISHNKITMEMADQLIGVTMHEPGVSRIVAVNIEQAVAMADAG
ncbi:AAA family ATPase [Shewanella sp.]|uniref:AAA family ATPase n=1 Tax=Shewanella sp. TaxID=50422 RepID=UPI003A96BB20